MMPGFNLLINVNNFLSVFPQGDRVFISYRNIEVVNTSVGKFKNDNCFYENENFIIVLDGVILNKYEFVSDNLSWEETIIKLYLEEGESFYKCFRGSFAGFIYDKKNNTFVVYTDHIGSKHIYYSKIKSGYLFSSDISAIYEFFKKNNISNKLNVNAAYMLLSYGFMLEDNTLSVYVRKILPGNYIKIRNNQFFINEYYHLSNEPNHELSESDIIENMDSYFRKAIKRQFEKDLEYGYKHFVALSGGLDSRMTAWVAHEMGYTNQLNFTFSQSDYLDEIIPKQISSYLKHEWIFKALDNGLFLKDIDDVTKITGGNVLYYGLAHGLSLIKYINPSKLGIMHSGQLGDVVFGTFYKKINNPLLYKVGDGAYSIQLVNKVDHSSFEKRYVNQEMFNFYQRGFGGANNGLLVSQQFTETMSPFYDIDLMEFALSIPVSLRFDHNIYKKWVLKKYPEAAGYVWEKTKVRLNAPTITIKGRKLSIEELKNKVLGKLGISKYGLSTRKHMNPLDYWLDTNIDISEFFNYYYNENVLLIDDKELKKDVKELFNTGKATEKIQVLSLLSGVKFLWG